MRKRRFIFFSSKNGVLNLYGRVIAGYFLSLCLVMFPSDLYANDNSSTEAALRAAVIVGILRFTSWPQPSSSHDLDICLTGNPLSSEHLFNLDGNLKIKGNNIHVRKVNKLVDLKNCQTLILGESIQQSLALKMLEYTTAHPIISICDNCKSVHTDNVTIALALYKQRIQFDVDWVNAKKKGILFDSSLLELASNQRRNN